MPDTAPGATSELAAALRGDVEACVQCAKAGTTVELEHRLSAALFKAQQLQFDMSTRHISGEPSAQALRLQNAEMRAEIEERQVVMERHRQQVLDWHSQLKSLNSATDPSR